MANESAYTIAPLSPETWSAFDALVQRHNGIFGGCWCIWFHPDCAERGQGDDGNRALKRRLVEQGRAHAALVFDGDQALYERAGFTYDRPKGKGHTVMRRTVDTR